MRKLMVDQIRIAVQNNQALISGFRFVDATSKGYVQPDPRSVHRGMLDA